MSDLSGGEIKLLRSAIGQAFPNLNLFSIFLSDHEFSPLPAVVVNTEQSYEEALHDYIVNTVVPEALTAKLLEILATRRKISAQIRSLMDPVDVDKTQWLRIYKQGEVAIKYCDDEHVFDYFASYHPYTAELWSKVTERKAEQIGQSKCFLAVITPFDLDDDDDDMEGTILAQAVEDWVNSCNGPAETRKKFMLLYEKDEVLNWWNKWKERFRTRNPAFNDKAIFVRELRNDQIDRANAKAELERFLSLGERDDQNIESNVLVLGNPLSKSNGASSQSCDIELFDCLRRYNPERVQHWEDGWSETKRLTGPERTELFKYNPIFVRSATDKNMTVAGLKDGLIFPLMNALGYGDDDLVSIWRDIVGKFQRVYWRSEGEWWDGGEINHKVECAWTGSSDDIGAKLAKLAGFNELFESKLRTRFENLPDSDPNRELLSTNLQELGKTVVKQGEYETVAVSLDSLDESVKRFNRAQLNIVAAHDQRTRPGDRQHTINHFEDWDTRIDGLVSEYFPEREPKIFRIAVLFQNFDKFDGLKFDEGLSVRRWNLLKIKRENNRLVFNSNDLNHLKDAAKDLMGP